MRFGTVQIRNEQKLCQIKLVYLQWIVVIQQVQRWKNFDCHIHCATDIHTHIDKEGKGERESVLPL